MVLSKRERYVGIGATAAIALFALDRLLITPYFARMADVTTRRDSATAQRVDADSLFHRQRRAQKIWKELQQGGLEVNNSQAESQALRAVLGWADDAGLELTALKPERPSQEGSFEVIGFDATGNGSLRSVSRLLYSLETARIPVRVNEVRIKPRKEGTDDLTVSLSVSALCKPPAPADKPSSVAPPAAAASIGGAS